MNMACKGIGAARQLAAFAVGLMLMSSASAVRVTAGEGQALLFPVYTTERLDSLFTITNHDQSPTAISVIIREGDLGAAVLAFYAYLTPRDTFRFTLSDLGRLGVGEGPVVLVPREDQTCTVPQFGRGDPALPGIAYQPLLTFQLGSFGGSPESMSAGYVEVIEVGEVAPSVDVTNCANLVERWTSNGVWAQNSGTDMRAPQGRLSGRAWLIDVAAGESYVYQATALDEYRTSSLRGRVGLTPSIFESSQSTVAVIRQGDSDRSIDFGDGYAAVTAALTSTVASVPIVVDERLAAQTDIAITLPSFFTAITERLAVGGVPRSPFQRPSPRVFVDYELVDQDGLSAVDCASLSDEGATDTRRMVLERALTIIPLGSQSVTGEEALPLLWSNGATRAYADLSSGQDGEFVLRSAGIRLSDCNDRLAVADDHQTQAASTAGATIAGLPIIATALTRIRNGTLEGGDTLANYGGAHKAVTQAILRSP